MLQYSFMQYAFIVGILISILCPMMGMFLVLRRYSMIGDTLAHSALAGVSIGFILGGNPIIGAFLVTSFFGVIIEILREYFKKYAELILAIVLSLSAGIAITLISSGIAKGNVESFLFGSILTVSKQDLYTVIILSVISFLALFFLYNQLIFIAYDEEGATLSNIRVKLINYIFAILVSATIAVSIRIVGVMVLSSMFALPVATALQLKKGFKKTLIFSIIFSIINIVVGIIISYYFDAAPGGISAILSVITLIFVISLVRIRKM